MKRRAVDDQALPRNACTSSQRGLPIWPPGRVALSAAAGTGTDYTAIVGVVMLAIALFFVWRSFYAMRIPLESAPVEGAARPEMAKAHA